TRSKRDWSSDVCSSDLVTNDVLWLGLNRNIQEYFKDELDYCIAADFNIVYGESRTEIGEAEYQLKYNIARLSEEDKKKYTDIVKIGRASCRERVQSKGG